VLSVREEDLDKITEAFHLLLKGRVPGVIELPPGHADDELKQAVTHINRFIAEHAALNDAVFAMSRGDLNVALPASKMQLLQALKNLHANLRHLTWKTQQIAGGDFSQTVDFMGDFSAAFNTMTQQLHDAFQTIERQNTALQEANGTIQREKDKSDQLLLNVLPRRVAEELKQTGKSIPQLFDNVTVLFSDMVGFTTLSAGLPPQLLIAELNEIFTTFDDIARANDCERIKTIGDAYLAVCGMPEANAGHACQILQAASQMIRALEQRNATAQIKWRIRVGVHSGPVVGAVVGVSKYIYDVFGDTVNTASRMESHSEPMRINVSEATHARAGGCFRFAERPAVEVKGKGSMRMYFLEQTA